MSKDIFRKVSLDRLSSPEQLDQLLRLTPAYLWVSLAALAALVALVTAWGVAGSLQTRVNGTGVLLRPGGVSEVSVGVNGRVMNVMVSEGDEVEEGQVIARIEKADLVDALAEAQDRAADLRLQEREARLLAQREAAAGAALRRQRRADIQTEVSGARERFQWLEDKMDRHRALLDEGLTTEQAVEATRLEKVAVVERIERLETELEGLQASALQEENQRLRALSQVRIQAEDAERQQVRYRAQLERSVDVVASHSGRVIELVVNPGQVVGPGTPIARLDREGQADGVLTALVYVPSSQGKKIRPGMPVHVSPSAFNREEFGGILGTVERVSDFPATQAGMLRTLSSPNLVQLLTSGASAPYEVRVRLETDPETPSGYAWSTSRGPDGALQSGTVATAAVAIRARRPITLVVPALRRWFNVSS